MSMDSLIEIWTAFQQMEEGKIVPFSRSVTRTDSFGEATEIAAADSLKGEVLRTEDGYEFRQSPTSRVYGFDTAYTLTDGVMGQLGEHCQVIWPAKGKEYAWHCTSERKCYFHERVDKS